MSDQAPWPAVLSLDTPLALHLCPHVGKGLLVVPEDASEAQFAETMEIIQALEWTLGDESYATNLDGSEVVEVSGDPFDVVTAEALQGAFAQLERLTRITEDTPTAE